MPRRRATQAVLSGCAIILFAAGHAAAQRPYESSDPPKDGEVLESHTVPGNYREVYPDVMAGYGDGFAAEPLPTGMDQIRQYPHPGPEWAATHAYPNYDFPDHLFGIWFRSQAWGLTKRERCGNPDPWRPRGYGNLFARPTTPHRMDYNREVLVDPCTGYGPSYFVRQPDPNCCVRDCDGHRLKWNSRWRQRQLQYRLDEATQVRVR